MRRTNCLVCESDSFSEILDLGNQPYADTFIHKKNRHDLLPIYRLSCTLCESCGQIQTGAITNPSERYNLFDYSYTSSNSSVAKNHWGGYNKEVMKNLPVSDEYRICEIGSNDGYLLGLFKETTQAIVGLDASECLVKLANLNGIPTVQCLFDLKESRKILQAQERFNLVMANNVFNHANKPVSFAKGVNNLLQEGGHFVFEVPYWKNTVDSQKIDQVYHEHVSYFTATSARQIMDRANFQISDIKVVDYHGGSLRIYAKKVSDKNAVTHCPQLQELIEKEAYLFKKETYQELRKEIQRKKILFLKDILDIKTEEECPIIAIGAAAKGNTFLNYMNLDSTIIDCVTDSSAHKQGKVTPLTNIAITSDDVLAQYDKVYAIILSWNLSDKIKEKLLLINKNIEFINFYKDYQ